MTLEEREEMILATIDKLEEKLIALRYCEYDGIKSFEERQQESDRLQRHLRTAYSVLLSLRRSVRKQSAA